MPHWVRVVARDSALSKAQVEEVSRLLNAHRNIRLEPIFLKAKGDIDLITPLTARVDSNFFTEEIDEKLFSDEADIAIHSAKDLPKPLPSGLEIIALTKGEDPRDSLVSRHYTLNTLPYGARIGVCSERRIEALKELRADLVPIPVRGPIDRRIALMDEGSYDGLILAEAGLRRLKMDVPREILDIPVAPLQGRLAIVAKVGRVDLKELFSLLDAALCG